MPKANVNKKCQGVILFINLWAAVRVLLVAGVGVESGLLIGLDKIHQSAVERITRARGNQSGVLFDRRLRRGP